MEQQHNNSNPLLDVEYVQTKIDEGFKYIEEASDKDLVLVIGNTGVGKSTTANYLKGHRMKENVFNFKTVIETVDETDIKIGHEVKAETLYAQTILVNKGEFHNKNNTICLLDCPGFLGNRTVEERIIESITTELAIRNARQIKGILILISIFSLLETRLPELRQLIKTLISLFKDPIEMVRYSVFIITKKQKFMGMSDSAAKQMAIGTLNSLKDHCQKQSKLLKDNQNLSSSEDLTYSDYDKIATYFSVVLERQDNIVYVDPLDEGESRQLILDCIDGINPRTGNFKKLVQAGISLAKKTIGIDTSHDRHFNPITITDLNFSEYDEYRIKFNNTMYDRAHNGNLLINEIREYVDLISDLYSEKLNNVERITVWKQLQCSILKEICKTENENGQCSKDDFLSTTILESIVNENNKQIKSIKIEIALNESTKGKLNEQLKSIDIDDPVIFRQNSINKTVKWWKIFGWEELKFSANTGSKNIPIIRIDKEKLNGTWYYEVDFRNEGNYKITYQSKFRARPATASVTAYIKTKDEEGNVTKIKEIKKELIERSQKQEQLKLKIDDIKSKIDVLESTIDLAKTSKEGYKNNLKQKLKECEKDIEDHNSMIEKIQQDQEKARISGLASLQDFDDSRHKFDIIVSIAALLEFPSSIIKQFISQYNEFLSEVDYYKRIFSEGNICLDSVPQKKDSENFDLRDPITGGKIRDLVVTSRGTLFDELSLLKQFDTTKRNILPFLFKQEDDTIEEIEYLSWIKIKDIQNYFDKLRNEKFGSQLSLKSLTKSEISKMNADELQKQREELLQKMCEMEKELDSNETELDKVCRTLKKQ